MRLRCILGIHDWIYKFLRSKTKFPIRTCTKCFVKDVGSYDMSYGETIWVRKK